MNNLMVIDGIEVRRDAYGRYRKMSPGYLRKGSFRSGTAQPG